MSGEEKDEIESYGMETNLIEYSLAKKYLVVDAHSVGLTFEVVVGRRAVVSPSSK